MTLSIKRAYVRRYSDNRQIVAYVDWSDGSRTEGAATTSAKLVDAPVSIHMRQLFARAKREGLTLERDDWA